MYLFNAFFHDESSKVQSGDEDLLELQRCVVQHIAGKKLALYQLTLNFKLANIQASPDQLKVMVVN